MYTIAHITDLHQNDFLSNYYRADSAAHVQRVLGDAIANKADCVVLTGDFGDPAQLKNVIDSIKSFGLPYYLSLGNHDDSDQIVPYIDASIQNPRFFSRMHINGHYALILNSHMDTIQDEQMRWLESELSACDGPVCLFLHHPVLDCGRTIMDKKYPLKNRKAVSRLLYDHSHPVYVFAGHYHNEFYTASKNIIQYVTPSCMVQLLNSRWRIKLGSRSYGYRLVELNGREVATRTIMFD